MSYSLFRVISISLSNALIHLVGIFEDWRATRQYPDRDRDSVWQALFALESSLPMHRLVVSSY